MDPLIRYTDLELEALIDDSESDLAERKQSWKGDAPDKSRQAICAFANDLPDHRKPGVLFVGVTDEGKPTGLPIDDPFLRTLADIKTDGKIVPPPTLIVEKRVLKGIPVAVPTAQPADAPPTRYDGRIWIRIGPRRGIASAQDERILSEKRRHRDLPFDVQPVPSSHLRALNRVLFEGEYLPNAFAQDILEANDRTYEERLSACKMIATAADPTPTILGLLTLGISPRDWLPGAYVQFARIQGTEFSDPIIDEAVLDGPMAQLLRRLDEKIEAHNTQTVDLTTGSIESRVRAYPTAALRQLTRNAAMHRTYEGTHAPIRLYWFDDRIEIHNPGGPYGSVTAENFGRPGLTDYRNPHLAEALKVLGFVQRFGVGIATAQALLRKNGNPPAEFEVHPTSIMALVRRTP